MDIVERLRRTETHVTNHHLNSLPIFREALVNPDGPEAADEIERLREALQKIVDKNPFHNQCPPAFDLQYYATTVAEMVAISRAALKEDE